MNEQNRRDITEALGLGIDATDDAILERAAVVKAQRDVADRLEGELATRKAHLAALEGQLIALREEQATLQRECAEATARAAAATDRLLLLEVDSLVGTRIKDAERESFIELGRKDRGLFDKMIAQRSFIKQPSPAPSLACHANEVGKVLAEDDLADIESKLDKDAEPR